jgi:hypothetical protein
MLLQFKVDDKMYQVKPQECPVIHEVLDRILLDAS